MSELFIFRVSSGKEIDLFGLASNEQPSSNTAVSVEKSAFSCFHEFKPNLILKRKSFNYFDIKHQGSEPEVVYSEDYSTSDAFIVPYNIHGLPANYYTIYDLVSRKKSLSIYNRCIFHGETSNAFYELFLIYSFPVPSFILTNGKLSEVSSESMRRLSYRNSLSCLSPKAKKIGCLVDSISGSNNKIINELSKLARKFSFKVYFISVGRIEDYKLGNFPEIDLFVNIQCQFCFDWKVKYIKPVLSFYEFVCGLMDCFWDYPYGDYNLLLPRTQSELLSYSQKALIENSTSDFNSSFSCNSLINAEYKSSTKIEIGTFGTPKAYQDLL